MSIEKFVNRFLAFVHFFLFCSGKNDLSTVPGYFFSVNEFFQQKLFFFLLKQFFMYFPDLSGCIMKKWTQKEVSVIHPKKYDEDFKKSIATRYCLHKGVIQHQIKMLCNANMALSLRTH